MDNLNLSGYKPYTEVLAQMTQRANGRRTYIVALPLHLLSQYVPIPDPEKPFAGNRRVDKRHAAKFGEYWRANDTWTAPPLLVDTTMPLDEGFEPLFDVGGVAVGKLQIHRNASSEFAILDGQHRILGWKLMEDKLAKEYKEARAELKKAEEDGNPDQLADAQKKLEEIEVSHRRFETEFVTLEIMQGVSEEDHKQAFNDIATNARGITKSVTVSFDRRSMINRIAVEVAESIEFLADRVDWEKDRVAGKNENVISGKSLADIVRHLALGIDGRMTNRREDSMSEERIADLVEVFFELLLDTFPQLQNLDAEEISPIELREKDMITSATVLRVLAGVFHALAVDISDESNPKLDKKGLEEARELFEVLSGHTGLPLDPRWLDTGFFPENAKAPSSRAQDLRGLTNLLVQWALQGEIFAPSKAAEA